MGVRSDDRRARLRLCVEGLAAEWTRTRTRTLTLTLDVDVYVDGGRGWTFDVQASMSKCSMFNSGRRAGAVERALVISLWVDAGQARRDLGSHAWRIRVCGVVGTWVRGG